MPIPISPFGLFSVVDYGATGNGTTDDSAAIQAAHAAASTAGGVLYFPPGQYFYESATPITITTTETVYAAGAALVGGTVFGAPTGVTATTLTMSGTPFVANAWVGYTLLLTDCRAIVTSNTSSVLTFSAGWIGGTPVAAYGGIASLPGYVLSNTADAFVFSAAIPKQLSYALPNIQCFANGAAVRVQTNAATVFCAFIGNCLFGFLLDANSGQTVLQNTLTTNFISACVYAVAYNSASVGGNFQGNIISAGFVTACQFGVAWLNGGAQMVCTNNIHNLYAIDPIGCCATPSFAFWQDPAMTGGVSQNYFNAQNYFGGTLPYFAAFDCPQQSNNDYVLDPASTAYANFGTVPYNSRIKTIGANAGYTATAPIELQYFSNMRSTFNGGATPTPQTFFATVNLPGGLAANTAMYLYGYSWLLSGETPISVQFYSPYLAYIFTAQDETVHVGTDGYGPIPNQFVLGLYAIANIPATASVNLRITIG